MEDTLVFQEYSADGEYRFEVYLCRNFYKVWAQKKITDDYMGVDWFGFYDISDYTHLSDSIERAIEIGRECLRCLM